jgi:SAM-dependent methyltransferase
MRMQDALHKIEKYYSDRVVEYGPTHKGVDWNSESNQTLRFEQLLKVIETPLKPFSVLDYGCGYGGLFEYMKPRFKKFSYEGYDISEPMIAHAAKEFKTKQSSWKHNKKELKPADYIIASGLFNVKLETKERDWMDYMLKTLDWFNRHAQKGFAFNLLTTYCDKNRMKDYLFYCDPLFIFDYSKKNYSNLVSLLHDYPLYDFTIIVRKEKN